MLGSLLCQKTTLQSVLDYWVYHRMRNYLRRTDSPLEDSNLLVLSLRLQFFGRCRSWMLNKPMNRVFQGVHALHQYFLLGVRIYRLEVDCLVIFPSCFFLLRVRAAVLEGRALPLSRKLRRGSWSDSRVALLPWSCLLHLLLIMKVSFINREHRLLRLVVIAHEVQNIRIELRLDRRIKSKVCLVLHFDYNINQK